MEETQRGEFIAIEGIDGSGTTTQTRMLVARLQDYLIRPGMTRDGLPVWGTFEPTDGPVGRIVRQALRGELEFSDEALLALFAVDRDWHVYNQDGINARRGLGIVVVTARYYLSQLVYNATSAPLFQLALALNRQYPLPGLTIVLDVSPGEALARIRARGGELELFETEARLSAARERYLSLAKSLGQEANTRIADGRPCGYVEVVDGSGVPGGVHQRVLDVVRERLPHLRDI